MKRPHSATDERPTQIVLALARWFRRHARDLPWRADRNPYRVWVSEIMLQQTQVATALPYWVRWMDELPSVMDLSRVEESRLLELWAGLGYYSRARNLQRAAREIVDRYAGEIPCSLQALRALPGIGPYTAGAILSIAFDRPHAAIDGNVVRVISRIESIHDCVDTATGRSKIETVATNWMQCADGLRGAISRPCDTLTQSLMELGATRCHPSRPKCGDCPARDFCRARRQGATEDLPARKPRAESVKRRIATIVLRRGAEVLLNYRDEEHTTNVGFWEFPTTEPNGSIDRLCREILGATSSASLEPPQYLGEFRHSITKYRIECAVYVAHVDTSRVAKTSNQTWRSFEGLRDIPMTTISRKALQLVEASGDTRNTTDQRLRERPLSSPTPTPNHSST